MPLPSALGFVRNYNMHNMGKTIGELHAMLIEYEKVLPKKAETPQEPQFILRRHREISEDLRLVREINDLCARVIDIVDERESFVDELDMLVGRPVPDKMAEFMRQVQGKDIPNLMKLQILEREFELRAQEKGVFIEKLKGNVDF
ncbi:hypothetical protein Tco_1233152 [Tanacetum coccineum]